jgi:hypothetical protein
MTEEAYQAARILMRSANHMRGQITSYNSQLKALEVIEDWHKKEGHFMTKKMDCKRKRIMDNLQKYKDKFKALEFPDSNLSTEVGKRKSKCMSCGESIPFRNQYCDECIINNNVK